MNINSLLRELSGPRPLFRVRNPAKLGCWHPSATYSLFPSGRDSHSLSAPTHANMSSHTLYDDVFGTFVTFCRGTGFQVTHRRVDSGNDPENGFWAFPSFHASFIERSRKWVHRVSSSIYGHKTYASGILSSRPLPNHPSEQ